MRLRLMGRGFVCKGLDGWVDGGEILWVRVRTCGRG